jgi:hypothetical protein
VRVLSIFCVMISDAHDPESERKYDRNATALRYFRLLLSALPFVRAECGLRHLWLGRAALPHLRVQMRAMSKVYCITY